MSTTTYTIEWSRAATKGLEPLSASDRKRVLGAVEELAQEPRGPNVKALHGGHEKLWRKRVGDFRIVYTIEDARLYVLILRVANRREVYR